MDDQESRAIGEVVNRLRASYPDVPAEAVASAVRAAQAELADHPIRDFVPVLVERAAREQLRGEGLLTDTGQTATPPAEG